MESYKDLIVWQKSIKLVTEVYNVTNRFPKSEVYGLSNQMRRSAISIPSNIAEGYARQHRQEYIQFLKIAYGSGAELETQLIIAQNLNFATEEELHVANELLLEIMKMLNKLLASLQPKS